MKDITAAAIEIAEAAQASLDIARAPNASPLDILKVYEHSDILHINIITTWRCNLRCSHCNVKHHLVWESDEIYEMERLDKFIATLVEKYPHRYIKFLLIGGEVFTETNRLRRILDVIYKYSHGISMTTNLTRLPDDFNLLSKIGSFQVSIDGLPDEHDKQRGGEGLFAQVFYNLCKMREMGLIDRVLVSGTLDNNRETYTPADMAKFKAIIMLAGVSEENISMGLNNPTTSEPEHSSRQLTHMATARPYLMPCCGYRFMNDLAITPDGSVWTHYYGFRSPDHLLGTIDDDFDAIRNKYSEQINKAPFIKDPKCRTCPALKVCWGMHCYAKWQFTKDPRPSEFCNQDAMIEMAKKYDKNNNFYPLVSGISRYED